MPLPTNPACSGSCPEPPPETRATLPGLRVLRRTNLRSSPAIMMSACAATKPSKLSSSKVCGELRNFFIDLPMLWKWTLRPQLDLRERHAHSIVVPDKLRQSARRLAHQFVKSTIFSWITEVVDLEFQAAQSRALAGLSAPVRVGALKELEEQ